VRQAADAGSSAVSIAGSSAATTEVAS